MNNILNFIIGFTLTVSVLTVLTDVKPEQYSSIENQINYLICISGGVFTAIIIFLLKKKLPEWFASKSNSENQK